MKFLTPQRQNVVLVALACAFVPWLSAEAMPRLFPASTVLLLCIGASLAIAGLALNQLLGYAGQLSLGHAALLGVGAFGGSVVVDRWRAPMFLAWVAAALVGGLVALVIGLPALRLRGLYLALITIVFGITMQASVLRWEIFTRGSAGASLPRRLWGDTLVSDPAVLLSMTLVVLLGVFLVDRNLLRTKVGRAFRIIREDETAAQAFGIDVTRYKLFAFVLSGAITGLAGALYGHSIGLVNSDVFTLELSLRIVLLVIIGGVGRPWGIVVVSILMALAPKLPDFLQGWDLVFAAFVVVYNVVRLPEGLAGLVAHERARRRVVDVHDAESAYVGSGFAVPTVIATETGDTEVLRVTDVQVRFGGLMAVDEVSMRLERGSIVGLIGPNGAGKSTLFNSISGFVPGARGEVVLNGQRIDQLPPFRRAQAGLGRTFQLVGLGKDMTVRDAVLLAQHQHASYGDAAALAFTGSVAAVERRLAEVADEAIAALGFERYAETPVGNLSGGQQRLVELAAVLANAPSVLLLDEPTAGLSPAAAENLAERLHELRDHHQQSIVLIEHNVPLVLDLCDRIYVLAHGRLLAEGSPDDLANEPEILGAYLGTMR